MAFRGICRSSEDLFTTNLFQKGMAMQRNGIPIEYYRQHDISGFRSGRLVVVGRGVRKNHWNCICDCGNYHEVGRSHLMQFKVKSCGCLHRESSRRNGKANTRHGMSKSPEHGAWDAMLCRCYYPSSNSYYNYGARGIRVCDKWKNSFEAFYEDMGPRPSSDHSLDRIDTSGDYGPENCRWATSKEQGRNRRTNRVLEFNGESKSMIEWSEELGLDYTMLRARIKSGWPVTVAFALSPCFKKEPA